MKLTGIVRKMDELGRVVIPKEMRRVLSIESKDSLEIYVDGDSIVLGKYSPGCIFCGRIDEVIPFKGKSICKDCLAAAEKDSGT